MIFMSQLSLVQRVMHLFKKECIDLEIWSESYNKMDLKMYVDRVIKSLEATHPEFSVIYTKYSRDLEIFRHPIFAVHEIRFSGYLVRATLDVNPYQLKQSCMGLEMNENGERVSDIDIYFSDNTKISRKSHPLDNPLDKPH